MRNRCSALIRQLIQPKSKIYIFDTVILLKGGQKVRNPSISDFTTGKLYPKGLDLGVPVFDYLGDIPETDVGDIIVLEIELNLSEVLQPTQILPDRRHILISHKTPFQPKLEATQILARDQILHHSLYETVVLNRVQRKIKLQAAQLLLKRQKVVQMSQALVPETVFSHIEAQDLEILELCNLV